MTFSTPQPGETKRATESGDQYAEGRKVEITCRKCGQAAWIVYHGPRANHTIEGREAELARSERERASRLEAALREIAEQTYREGHDDSIPGPTIDLVQWAGRWHNIAYGALQQGGH